MFTGTIFLALPTMVLIVRQVAVYFIFKSDDIDSEGPSKLEQAFRLQSWNACQEGLDLHSSFAYSKYHFYDGFCILPLGIIMSVMFAIPCVAIEAIAVPTGIFDLIHGDVGGFENFVQINAIIGIKGNPNRCPNRAGMT